MQIRREAFIISIKRRMNITLAARYKQAINAAEEWFLHLAQWRDQNRQNAGTADQGFRLTRRCGVSMAVTEKGSAGGNTDYYRDTRQHLLMA